METNGNTGCSSCVRKNDLPNASPSPSTTPLSPTFPLLAKPRARVAKTSFTLDVEKFHDGVVTAVGSSDGESISLLLTGLFKRALIPLAPFPPPHHLLFCNLCLGTGRFFYGFSLTAATIEQSNDTDAQNTGEGSGGTNPRGAKSITVLTGWPRVDGIERASMNERTRGG